MHDEPVQIKALYIPYEQMVCRQKANKNIILAPFILESIFVRSAITGCY
jgi:hypothetical protein